MSTDNKVVQREEVWVRFCGILEQAGLLKNGLQTMEAREVSIDDLQSNSKVSWATLNGVLDMLNQSDDVITKNMISLAASSFWGDDSFQRESCPTRLGELLQGAGIVSEDSLVKAVFDAHASKRPVGAILIEKCLISQAVLDQVLLVQELVRMDILGLEAAQELLQSMHKTRPAASMLMAQEELNLPDGFTRARGLIMLVAAGIVTTEDLASAMVMGRNMRSDILTALVFLGYVHSDKLQLLWETLAKLDSRELSVEESVNALKRPRVRSN